MGKLQREQLRIVERGHDGVLRHMAIRYQDPNKPWWAGRSMFRMLHETFIGEYLTKRAESKRCVRRDTELPYESGVVGFWVSQDGLVMSANSKLDRYVFVALDPLDWRFLHDEAHDAQANLYWSAYVTGYWIHETSNGTIVGDWIWVENPVFAAAQCAEKLTPPTRPFVSKVFLGQCISATFATMLEAS